MTQILELKNLSISVGKKNILHGADLSLKERTLCVIMGPMGGGKSTLLNFLAGEYDKDTFDIKFDKADYGGKPLGQSGRPEVIFQKVREQGTSESKCSRRLDEIRNVQETSNEMLCIDEPTAGLSTEDGAKVMQSLREMSQDRTVLVISHNTEEARKYSDQVALIAGGRVVSTRATDEFFDGKSDELATWFLSTGGLDIPHENTPIHNLAPENRVAPAGYDKSMANPTEGKDNWIIQDMLSVISLPVDEDGCLEVNYLTTLTPPRNVFHFDREELKIYNPKGEIIKSFTWGSLDKQPDRNPSLSSQICCEIEEAISIGQQVAINSSFNQNSGAAIVGAYMIMKNFSPSDALEIAGRKFPLLHMGMRIEQFLWDVDIELSMLIKE